MKSLLKGICLLLSILIVFSLSACKEETPSEPVSSVESSSVSKKPNGQVVGEEGEMASGVWSGKVAEGVQKGGGTEELPFYIYTAEELAYALTEGGADGYFYQLQNDIYLNDVSSAEWFKNKNNNPWLDTKDFNGSLDGNGFCIYGLWYDSENLFDNAGLLSSMEGGTIKNLGIRKSFIVANNYVGGFVGVASASKKVIENCFVDETVYVQYASNGNNGAGGIIGYAAGNAESESTLDIINCYSKAQVTGRNTKERVNGIIGTAWTCSYTMKNCYSIGQAPYFASSEKNASTLLSNGVAAAEVYSNIYTDSRDAANKEVFKKLSLSKMKNSSAASSLAGFDFSAVWEAVEGGSPKLKVFTAIDGKDIAVTTAIGDVQTVKSDFTSGLGTKEKPYVVTTAEQLRKVVSSDWSGTYFSLEQDIYVNDTSKASWSLTGKGWVATTTSAFSGYFEGNGHTVYGLLLSEIPETGKNMGSGGAGLFPAISTSAVIRNVHIKDASITGKTNVGGIAGTVNGNKNSACAQIIGCSVDESVILRGQTVGGIIGSGGGGANIAYCGFSGVIVEATGSSGNINRGNGIVGDIWSTNYRIAECYSANYKAYRDQFKPAVIGAVYGVAQKGVTPVTAEQMQGEAARTSMPELNWGSYWNTTATYPVPLVIPTGVEYAFE